MLANADERKNLLEKFHGGYVRERRARALSGALAGIMPKNARALDVGCGDGLIDKLVVENRPDLNFQGIDVLIRQVIHGEVKAFDGLHVPFDDSSFDVVALVDVMHHSDEPQELLAEAKRVARDCIVIKDVMLEGFLSGATLRFMDRVGNERFGVACPFNFWTRQRWTEAFDALGLKVETWQGKLGLYPWPANWMFERSFHFVTRLSISSNESR